MAQWVRTFAPQAECWVLESQVVKTGSDSSTAKRSAIGVSILISLLKPRAIAHVSNEAHSPFCTEI